MKIVNQDLILGDKRIPLDFNEYMNVDNDYGVSIHDFREVKSSEFPEKIRIRVGFYPHKEIITWLSLEKCGSKVFAYVEIVCDYHDWKSSVSIEKCLENILVDSKLFLNIVEDKIEPDIGMGMYFVGLKYTIDSDEIYEFLMKSIGIIFGLYSEHSESNRDAYKVGPLNLDVWKFGPIKIDTVKTIKFIQKKLTSLSKGRS